MDQFEAMKVFVRIVESGGLTAAARTLDVSLPAVARGLAGLEKRLGTRLLNRTTRKIGLTESGARYVEHCRRILAEMAEAEATLSAQRLVPSGTLNVSAPVAFGRLHVAPLLPDFLALHADVSINLVLVDRLVNLVDEGFDIAIRIGHLADSSLVATRLGTTRRVICASPEYLRRHGRPRQPRDLKRHNCIRFTALNPGREWTFRGKGRTESVRVPSNLSCNIADAVIEAAAKGLGLATLLSYQIQRHLAASELEIVLRDFEPPPIPVHAIYPHGNLLPAKSRAFVDYLVERLRRKGAFGG